MCVCSLSGPYSTEVKISSAVLNMWLQQSGNYWARRDVETGRLGRHEEGGESEGSTGSERKKVGVGRCLLCGYSLKQQAILSLCSTARNYHTHTFLQTAALGDTEGTLRSNETLHISLYVFLKPHKLYAISLDGCVSTVYVYVYEKIVKKTSICK